MTTEFEKELREAIRYGIRHSDELTKKMWSVIKYLIAGSITFFASIGVVAFVSKKKDVLLNSLRKLSSWLTNLLMKSEAIRKWISNKDTLMDKMTLLLGILMGSIAYKLFKSLYRQLFESYIFESKTSNIKNILAKTTIKMLGKVQGYIDKATSYLQHSVLNGEEKNGVVEVYDEISGDTVTISKEAAKKNSKVGLFFLLIVVCVVVYIALVRHYADIKGLAFKQAYKEINTAIYKKLSFNARAEQIGNGLAMLVMGVTFLFVLKEGRKK